MKSMYVKRYTSYDDFPTTGTSDTIYIANDTGIAWYWYTQQSSVDEESQYKEVYIIHNMGQGTITKDSKLDHPDSGFQTDQIVQWEADSGFYIYDIIFYKNIEPLDFETLKPDEAVNFREGINDNFNQVDQQAQDLENTWETLLENSSTAGRTGEAKDITTDSDHRFVSDAETAAWNQRIYAQVDSEGNVFKLYHVTVDQYNESHATDITSQVIALLESEIPTKLSELNNDVPYITEGYTKSEIKSITDVDKSTITFTSDTTHTGYSYKGSIPFTGMTTEFTPTIIFSEAQKADGRLSTVAESGSDVVYFWSTTNTAFTDNIPAVFGFKPTEP